MPRMPSKILAGSPVSAQDVNDLQESVRAGVVGQVYGAVVERHPSFTLVHGRRVIGQRMLSVQEYAFRVWKSGATKVTVTGGSAQMIGEEAREFVTQELTLPAVGDAVDDGQYVVYGRNEYGVGDEDGTWSDLAVCLLADLPSIMDGDRLIAENFRIATLTVSGGVIVGKPVQNWLWGDLRGYAPNLSPSEGPAAP